MQNRKIVFIVLLLALGRLHAQNSGVELQNLLAAAKTYHPVMQKQTDIAATLATQQDQLNRLLYPQLSANGQATYQSAVTSVPIAIPGIDVPSPPKDQYKATLDLQQSIYDGGNRLRQKQIAREQASVETERLALEWHGIQERIINLFFQACMAQEGSAQAESLQAYLNKQIEKAEIAVKNGILIEKDVLALRARQLEARQNRDAYNAQLAGIRKALSLFTNVQIAANATFQASAATLQPSITALQRPELRIFAAQRNLIAAQEQLAKVKEIPRVNAFAQTGFGRPALNLFSSTFDPFFMGGVQVKVPLSYLYTGSKRLELQQLRIHKSMIDKQEQTFTLGQQTQIVLQQAEIDKLTEMIISDAELLSLRERMRATTDTQLQYGTASMTDLITDINQEDQARLRKALHEVQLIQAEYQLEVLNGLK